MYYLGFMSRSRLQVDERRAQLLDLALELFADRTYEEISIDEIAKAAGISKGLLYHYFPGKRAFYVEAVRMAAQQLLDETEVAPNSDAIEGARQSIGSYLAFVEERAKAYSFLMKGGMAADPEVREIIDGTRALIVERMAGNLMELGSGELPPKARLIMRGYVGFVEASVLHWLEDRSVTRDELRDLIMEVVARLFAAVSLP